MEKFHLEPINKQLDASFVARRTASLRAETATFAGSQEDCQFVDFRLAVLHPPGLPAEPVLPKTNLYRDIRHDRNSLEPKRPVDLGRACAKILFRSIVQLGRDIDSALNHRTYPLK